jgi:cell shape-determining protein MreD
MMLITMMVVLFCCAVLQALLPAWAWFGFVKAPLLMGAVMYYAFTRGRGMVLSAAVLAGVMQDALGMIPLGYSSACFCIVGLLVQRFRGVVFVFRSVTHVVMGGLGNGLTTLVLVLLLAHDQLLAWVPGWTLSKLVGAIALGALTVPLVFRTIELLELKLGVLEGSM